MTDIDTSKIKSRICSVPGCGINKKQRPEIGFFSLPKNTQRAQYWLEQMCVQQSYRPIFVCEEHFEEAVINRTNPLKRRLDIDAVPTLSLPNRTATKHTNDYLQTTEQPDSPQASGAKLEDLISKKPLNVIKINKDISKKKDEDVVIKSAVPTSNSIQITQAQAQTNTIAGATHGNTEHSHGVQFTSASYYIQKLHEIQMRMKNISSSTKAYKQLSLKLYLRFPNEYKALHKALSAPPKAELKCVFDHSIISTDRNALFMTYLTQKANIMTTKQKQCFLSIGESKIKPSFYYDIKKDQLLGINDVDDVLKPEPATNALVLIIQGIFEEWKQPIAVGYLANDPPSMKPWIDKNIKILLAVGFHVRAVVFHKDPSFLTKDSYFINTKEVYFFHDLSSLLNSFYYNLTKFDYHFNGFIAKSQHIKDYYELDSKKRIRLTPKLTHNLLNPTSSEVLNIKSVMEVFSVTTAAAISAYIDFNLLDKSAEQTIELIIKMSKLYDILNTGGCLGDESKGFIGEQTQIEFLQEMLELFENLKLINPSNKSPNADPVVEKLRILIKCILALWINLRKEKYEYFPIWRFFSNATELFFDQVQKHSKSITKPTAKDVDSIFRQTAIIHLLKNPVKTFKPIQMEYVLTEFKKLITAFKALRDDYANQDNSHKIGSLEYNTLEMNRKDGIVFLAGFLLKKCIAIHICDDLKAYTRRTVCDVETLSMCESIMEDVKKNVCVLPGSEFIEFVESMEISFRTFMKKEILCVVNKKILNSLLKYVDNFEMPMLCPCFPVDYAKKLYMRFRIYHTLKYNNELNKTKLNRRLIVNKL